MASLRASRWADTPLPDEEDVVKEAGTEEETTEDVQTEIRAAEPSTNIGKGGPEELPLVETPGPEPTPETHVEETSEPIANTHAIPAAPTQGAAHLEPPRLRRRVSWRGKACIISIPRTDYDAMSLPRPMTSDEIQKRLEHFEKAGYTTCGFDLHDELMGHGNAARVKLTYPDESDIRFEANQNQPRVTLPDLSKWRAYTNSLIEQKLAALGVSTGLDELPPSATQEHSRHACTQYQAAPFPSPITTGPPSGLSRPNMARGHSHTMSVVSPLSPANGHFGHMHRHSTFTGPFGFSQLQAQQPQQAGFRSFSPPKQAAIPGVPRGESPAHLAAFRHDVEGGRGPSSPLGQHVFAPSPQDYSAGLVEDHRRRQQVHSQPGQHPPMQNTLTPQMPSVQQTPTLPELPEEMDEEEAEHEQSTYLPPHKRAEFEADVAVPTPTRSHGHNPSEGMEREALEAEQRHEEARRGRVDVIDAVDQPKSVPNTLSAPPPNPVSGNGTTGHGHKKSTSRYNVAAPPFNFNPSASFQPGSTAFSFGAPPPKTNGMVPKGYNREDVSSNFNLAAPSFTPADASALPMSDFSFTTQGPGNMPGATPVQPQKSSYSDDRPSIFGSIDIPDIVKPVKKSKAIAIVRPEDVAGDPLNSSEEFEDEEGRVAQSDDRLKRQRFGGDDGDEMPRFAEPTPMPDVADFTPQAPSLPMHERNPSQVEEAADGAKNEEDTADREVELHGRAQPWHGHKPSSSLSVFAKPFEPVALQPSNTDRDESDHQHSTSISELEDGEIREESTPVVSPVCPSRFTSSAPLRTSEPQVSHRGLASERIDDVAQPEPSFDEIDAVMRQLNEGRDAQDEQLRAGVEYLPGWPQDNVQYATSIPAQSVHALPLDLSFPTHDRADSEEHVVHEWPQVHRLNRAEDVPLSDWSGVLSPPEEEKLQQRSAFFDSHIGNVIGRVIERRLQPLEESFRDWQRTVNKRARSTDVQTLKRSSSAVHSDADDEDDLSEVPRHRPISRGRDKRVDEIKAAVVEALREQSPKHSQSSPELADLHSALADMKVSFARTASTSLELEDIRLVVEDVLHRQHQAVVPTVHEEGRHTHKRAMTELEGRLSETLAGALEEANHRHAIEERKAETRRQLRLAEEEIGQLRKSARDNDRRMVAMEDEHRDALERAERADEAQQIAETQVKSLEAEHEAMQGTLEEYRLSSTKWRQDIDESKHQCAELENTVGALERQLEDSQESSAAMRRRLEKLHSDMALAAGQLASEKAVWKAREDDYRARCEVLEAQLASQLLERSRLDDELHSVRASMLEASEARLTLDHTRASNVSLDELVRGLQSELLEQKSVAARFERDFHDARETGRAEVQRTRISFEADSEAANHQVNIVRAELESALLRGRMEMENLKIEMETAKARHERLMEEEESSRREALRKVNHANSVALEEARKRNDATLRDIAAQHSRALQHAFVDKQHSDYILTERLDLSEAKLQHSQDRILYLEERLEIAKSAAQAAATSAQAKAVFTAAPLPNGLPEKISPQALRESILVLQEQLQERETRIERLQTQVEHEGPAKLKERDSEITWLRELLAVRSEDLTDLVNTLSQPTFDRDNVRDTAIRIHANLQMEQQEKERIGQRPQSLGGQALAGLSTLANPKGTSFSSAFNKWRSTMESSALRNAQRRAAPGRSARSPTPSRPPISAIRPGYMVGLMTPPASNLRSPPSQDAIASLPPPRLQSRNGSWESGAQRLPRSGPQSRHVSSSSDSPATPLFQEQSYDRDAEDSKVQLESFEDDDLNVVDSEPPAFRSSEAELQPLVVDEGES